jgi:DNA-directed RNA polymerase specialized sigma24 family protein
MMFPASMTGKQNRLKTAFLKIKEEVDDHLDSINQNTNEIQANYEFLCELDSKIDKLTQKMEQLQMMFTAEKKPQKEYSLSVSRLTKKEQEVFMVLYTNEEVDLTYADIAKKLALKEDMVRTYVSGLSSKGVPIMKKFVSNRVYVYLEKEFKDVQAKENILDINDTMLKQFA